MELPAPASNGNAQNCQFAVKCRLLQLPTCGVTIGWTCLAKAPDYKENAMGEPFPETPPSEKPPEDRLDSWKEIAAYLDRDVTTAQRWEKREGMPVHRHVHDKRGSVYALAPELDAWLESRRPPLGEEPDEEAQQPEPPVVAEGDGFGAATGEARRATLVSPGWIALAGRRCTRPAGCRLRPVPWPRGALRRNPKSVLWRFCP